MVDQFQTRIQDEVRTLVDELDRSFLRGIQRTMHLCAAKCCENEEANVDSVHRCIENCSTPLSQSQNFIQNELTEFQVSIYKAEFEACAMQCADEHIKLMPSIKKRIATVLHKKS